VQPEIQASAQAITARFNGQKQNNKKIVYDSHSSRALVIKFSLKYYISEAWSMYQQILLRDEYHLFDPMVKNRALTLV
jgi:hypothetical protein